MSFVKTCCCITAIVFGVVTSASAAPIMPTFTTFGDLAGATFGGSGIPTDPTAITTIVDGSNTITLGLIAHERIANPPVTNDGAGTFFAPTGSNFGLGVTPSTFLGATWNFGFFIGIAGGGSFEDYGFELLYDFDPAADTDEAVHGILDFNTAVVLGGGTLSTTTLVQGSQNPLFGFLGVDSAFITAPTPSTFDPNAIGEYSFALIASDMSGELGRSAIHVNTVPEPSSMALLATGAIGFIGYRRRKRQQKAASNDESQE